MESNKKYYVPNIEDIFIGYECEYFNPYSNPQWEERIIDFEDFSLVFEDDILDPEWFKANYRTKYLDKDDIDNVGFEQLVSQKHIYENGHVFISCYEDYILSIHKCNKHGEEETLFEGYCPSINELRKILKLIQK